MKSFPIVAAVAVVVATVTLPSIFFVVEAFPSGAGTYMMRLTIATMPIVGSV